MIGCFSSILVGLIFKPITTEELKKRTNKFAIEIVKTHPFLSQISSRKRYFASSVVANYRDACRAQSAPNFHSPITIVEEEADQSLFWLELSEEFDLIPTKMIQLFKREAIELPAIFAEAKKTK